MFPFIAYRRRKEKARASETKKQKICEHKSWKAETKRRQFEKGRVTLHVICFSISHVFLIILHWLFKRKKGQLNSASKIFLVGKLTKLQNKTIPTYTFNIFINIFFFTDVYAAKSYLVFLALSVLETYTYKKGVCIRNSYIASFWKFNAVNL